MLYEVITVVKLSTIHNADAMAPVVASVSDATSVEKTKESINIQLDIPDPYVPSDAVRFRLTLSRDIYLTSMNQLLRFTIINTLVATAVAIVLVVIWGNRITKPFLRLVKEVGQIDTESDNYKRVTEFRGKEITLLSNSINHLLGRIESAQRELGDNKKKLVITSYSIHYTKLYDYKLYTEI